MEIKGIVPKSSLQFLENAKKGKCGPSALFQALALNASRPTERDIDICIADAMEVLLKVWRQEKNTNSVGSFHPDATSVMSTWTSDMIADVRHNGGNLPHGSYWNCHLLQRYALN